ncbi:hypothetical protein CRUP_017811, partial [Coryphaenoides rupestris]
PVSLTTTIASNTSKLPEGGDVAVKTEADQKFEGLLQATRYDLPGSFAPDKSREQMSAEGQYSPTSNPPPHVMLLKNTPLPLSSSSSSSSSSTIGEMATSRHVLHAPIPCRPLKRGALPFPWSVSEPADWAALAASTAGLGVQLNPLKPNPFLFGNLSPTGPPAGGACLSASLPRQPVERSPWPRQGGASEPQASKDPSSSSTATTRLFRVRSLSELGDSQGIALERKEMVPIQWRSVGPSQEPPPSPNHHHHQGPSDEGQTEGNDGPLDLSERGRSKSNGSTTSEQSVVSQGPGGEEKGFESGKTLSPNGPPSSCSPAVPTTPSSPSSGQAQELQKSSDHSKMQQKQVEPGSSSSEEKEEEGGPKVEEDSTSAAAKRTRSSVDKHSSSSREADMDDLKPQKKLKIRVGFQH